MTARKELEERIAKVTHEVAQAAGELYQEQKKLVPFVQRHHSLLNQLRELKAQLENEVP